MTTTVNQVKKGIAFILLQTLNKYYMKCIQLIGIILYCRRIKTNTKINIQFDKPFHRYSQLQNLSAKKIIYIYISLYYTSFFHQQKQE